MIVLQTLTHDNINLSTLSLWKVLRNLQSTHNNTYVCSGNIRRRVLRRTQKINSRFNLALLNLLSWTSTFPSIEAKQTNTHEPSLKLWHQAWKISIWKIPFRVVNPRVRYQSCECEVFTKLCHCQRQPTSIYISHRHKIDSIRDSPCWNRGHIEEVEKSCVWLEVKLPTSCAYVRKSFRVGKCAVSWVFRFSSMCSSLYLFYAIKFLCYCSCRVEMWNFIISWDIRYQIFVCVSVAKRTRELWCWQKLKLMAAGWAFKQLFLLFYEKSFMQLCWTVDAASMKIFSYYFQITMMMTCCLFDASFYSSRDT